MNFIVSSASLLKQLSLISGVLNSSNTLPILDNFLFEITGSDLTVSASDLETTMSTKLSVESKEDGLIAIPAKMLIDILKNLSDHPITFSIDKGNFSIEISSDYGKYKLSGHSGEEFPKVPAIEQPNALVLAADVLNRAINKTLFAAGNDDLRPVMSGVFCELGTGDITFVATDAHKLVRYKRLDAKSENTTSFILPSKPLNLLKNCLNNVEEVNVEYNQNNAFFSLGNINLICRLVEGKYPNYDAVIPKENPNVLTIDRVLLLSSVKRVSIFANKTTHQVKLKLAGSSLNISAEDLDFANKADERLTCSYSGEDMEIGFNSKFLMEMLNNIDSEEVSIEMSEPNRAGIILPGNKDNENEDMLMLVMPVMLN